MNEMENENRPTDEEIMNCDVVATVFIKVRIDQLRAQSKKYACLENPCWECYGLSVAIRELKNVL